MSEKQPGSDDTSYRGGQIQSFTFLSTACIECGAPAYIRVVRDNDNPPSGYMRGGSIYSEYCREHTPEEVRQRLSRMNKAD